MKVIVSTLTFVFSFAFICTAQSSFSYSTDFEVMLDESKEVNSEQNYHCLLQRFNNADTTLTNEEVIRLMIGFTFNVNYKPYVNIELEREIRAAVKDESFDFAIDLSNKHLSSNPLSLMANAEKWFSYYKLNHDSTEFYHSKLTLLMNAIHDSGEGTFNSPYFILSPIDGQVILSLFYPGSIGSMGSGKDKDGNFCDILEFIPRNGDEPHDVFFVIEHAMNLMMQLDK